MLNIEKYKDNILNAAQADITCCVIDLFHNGVCPDNCKDCKKVAMEWLLSECKEPILDVVEQEYLKAVIKPFRGRVKEIVKYIFGQNLTKMYICIKVDVDYCIRLPLFEKNSMYKGMKTGKLYTLKELGL